MLAGFTNRLKQEIQAFLKQPRFSKVPVEKLKFYKPNYYPNIMSWVGGNDVLFCTLKISNTIMYLIHVLQCEIVFSDIRFTTW